MLYNTVWNIGDFEGFEEIQLNFINEKDFFVLWIF